MNSRIKQLDPMIVGLIAAGEVVERPSLAIKELIENSMDAQATAITVEIRDGGLSMFRVTDNGIGIPAEDLRMAFTRHATSKLRRAEELEAIETLGFRGEALPSIAAVARVTLTSRPRGTEEGAAIELEGGNVLDIRAAASPEGTSIVVRDLFFNTPARLKFLKKPATEAGQVSDLVLRMMLARPDISMRLISNGKQVYRSPGDGNLRSTIAAVWGHGLAQNMIPIRGSAAGCFWEGFIGVGDAARTSRTHQVFFLNGRYVRSALLAQAVDAGCREWVTISHYPVFILSATMDFHAVDVNVHPNKLEVRFRDERPLYEGLMDLIQRCLRQSNRDAEPKEPNVQRTAHMLARDAASPMKKEKQTDVSENKTEGLSFEQRFPVTVTQVPPRQAQAEMREGFRAVSYDSLASWSRAAPLPTTGTPPSAVLGNVPAESTSKVEQQPLPVELPHEPLRILGAAFDTYLLVQQGETLYLIDQHAAHERLLYEHYREALDQGQASQALMVPLVVHITHRETALLQNHGDMVRAAGYEIEDFGDRAIRVTAVPLVMGQPQEERIHELLDALEEFQELPTAQKRREALIQHACKKAVKGGDPLTEEQIRALLEEMSRLKASPTCPHGRPICVAITRQELEKRFKRTQ